MALIKCPECGKENVSDSAESCPDCGYNIKKYVESNKKAALKQNEKLDTLKKSPINKMIFGIAVIIVVVIVLFVGIQKQRDKTALANLNLLFAHCEDINEYKTYSVMEIDGIYYYHDTGASNAISRIAQRLENVDICIEYIDEHYTESRNAIDDRIEEETNYGCRTWEEYRERLNSNYFIDEDISNNEKAEKIVDRYVNRMVEQ